MTTRHPSGKILKTLLIVLILATVIVAGGYASWSRYSEQVKETPPQMVTVKKGVFVHEILERGSVDSASNVDIRCQVESAGGVTILWVIPEGSIVKKGDLLVELDSSTLRENVTKQAIAVLASLSTLAESEAALATAKLVLEEYQQGKFEEEKKTIEIAKYTADEAVKTKENDIKFYKRLLERDYVTQSKVQTDLIDLEKAKLDAQIAELKLTVLENYTKKKNEIQYQADIAKAEAKVESDRTSLQLEKDRETHLKSQRANCRILAPQDGQVVYFMTRWGGEEDLIREGKKVYEREILLRLPDISQMQVKGLVNEANIRLLKVGQTATIRLEAFPSQIFRGIVRDVNDYPEPSHFMGGSMSKEYMTTIMILDPPKGIKPGLTAEAKITVAEMNDALILPMQSVFEHGGKTYALTFREGQWDKIEVKTGPTNDQEVVILEGLNAGDSVVLGAWAHRDRVNLPKLTPEAEAAQREKGPTETPGDKPTAQPAATPPVASDPPAEATTDAAVPDAVKPEAAKTATPQTDVEEATVEKPTEEQA